MSADPVAPPGRQPARIRVDESHRDGEAVSGERVRAAWLDPSLHLDG